MALVTGTDFVCIFTRNIGEAEKFYGEVLGLPMRKRWGEMPGVEYETGNLTLALMEPEKFGIGFQPSSQPIALRVEDVHAAKAELESHGVQFMGDIIDSGVCHQAFFTDPDGNAIGIHHRYAPGG